MPKFFKTLTNFDQEHIVNIFPPTESFMPISSQLVSSQAIYARHNLPPINPVYPDPKPVDFSLLAMNLAGHIEHLNKVFYDLIERGRVIDKEYGGGGTGCVRDAMLAHRHCRATYQLLVQQSVPRAGPKNGITLGRQEVVDGGVE
jgi:hypothetical protein